ncbi:SocA family protein [Salmonella enterica subsp. enterica serovar Newport]|nr:SocA family protein [Salmonella enterica subsp. enterica serovar Newport]EJW0496994.1 SocA family protein [Salmonella enterica subsp. enterica serovar Newport]ELA5318489.1 SocA family protein [Salmonella enterica subsp. enterica serovar Newport]
MKDKLMLNVRFNSEKALEAILYVASKAPIPDIYHVLKVFYFADRYHLERFGRLITGDHYNAMKDGPVASNAYDLIKIARGDGRYMPNGCDEASVRKAFCVRGDEIIPHRGFNRDFFSDSDLKCLDDAICVFGEKSFNEIRKISHDAAWEAADPNGEMSLESIVNELEDSDLILDYLKNGY